MASWIHPTDYNASLNQGLAEGGYAGTTIPYAMGGTNAATAAAAFNNLSPMVAGGDLIYGGTLGAATRLANGTSGYVLTSSGGTSAPSWAASLAASATSTPTANTISKWDVNSNMSANNFIHGFVSTVTSGSTLVLTLSSAYRQHLTGSTAQTVTLPDVTSGVALGEEWRVSNQSTAAATINTSTSILVASLSAGTALTFVVVSLGSDAASSWAISL